MGLLIELNPSTVGFQETIKGQIVNFSHIREADMEAEISTMTSGICTTVAQFNTLSTTDKSKYLQSYFNNPAKASDVTFNLSSVKYNNGTSDVILGSDSTSIQEGVEVEYDNKRMTLIMLSGEIQNNWFIIRFISTGSGRNKSPYEYLKIMFHDATYSSADIADLRGCLALYHNSSNNISTSPEKNSTGYGNIAPTNSIIYDGFWKIGNDPNTGSNGVRILTSLSLADQKAVNYIALVWSTFTSGQDGAVRFFMNSSAGVSYGIGIYRSGDYWVVDSLQPAGVGGSPWFTTVVTNGLADGYGTNKPLVLWTQTTVFEFIVTDTYVKIVFNGDINQSYNLRYAGSLLTRDLLDTRIVSVTRVGLQSEQTGIRNLWGFLTFFSYHPGTTSTINPDEATLTRIRNFMRALAKK